MEYNDDREITKWYVNVIECSFLYSVVVSALNGHGIVSIRLHLTNSYARQNFAHATHNFHEVFTRCLSQDYKQSHLL
jgi:hypothetical protein